MQKRNRKRDRKRDRKHNRNQNILTASSVPPVPNTPVTIDIYCNNYPHYKHCKIVCGSTICAIERLSPEMNVYELIMETNIYALKYKLLCINMSEFWSILGIKMYTDFADNIAPRIVIWMLNRLTVKIPLNYIPRLINYTEYLARVLSKYNCNPYNSIYTDFMKKLTKIIQPEIVQKYPQCDYDLKILRTRGIIRPNENLISIINEDLQWYKCINNYYYRFDILHLLKAFLLCNCGLPPEIIQLIISHILTKDTLRWSMAYIPAIPESNITSFKWSFKI